MQAAGIYLRCRHFAHNSAEEAAELNCIACMRATHVTNLRVLYTTCAVQHVLQIMMLTRMCQALP